MTICHVGGVLEDIVFPRCRAAHIHPQPLEFFCLLKWLFPVSNCVLPFLQNVCVKVKLRHSSQFGEENALRCFYFVLLMQISIQIDSPVSFVFDSSLKEQHTTGQKIWMVLMCVCVGVCVCVCVFFVFLPRLGKWGNRWWRLFSRVFSAVGRALCCFMCGGVSFLFPPPCVGVYYALAAFFSYSHTHTYARGAHAQTTVVVLCECSNFPRIFPLRRCRRRYASSASSWCTRYTTNTCIHTPSWRRVLVFICCNFETLFF